MEASSGTRKRLIICDCFYGWPLQKRPRAERVRAVAAQLMNFLLLFSTRRNCHLNSNVVDIDIPPTINRSKNIHSFELTVLGNDTDLDLLRARLVLLIEKNPDNEYLLSLINFRGNLTIEDCVNEFSSKQGISFVPYSTWNQNLKNSDNMKDLGKHAREKESVVYLSPDGETTINPSNAPPNIIVIGMLVDRRVTPGRSKAQAEKFGIVSAKLPMGTISVSTDKNFDTYDEMPMNIDTVLEIMIRWWGNYSDIGDQIITKKDAKESFINAAYDVSSCVYQ